MRLLTAVLATTFLAGSALAQPGTSPYISTPSTTISMAVGQAQKLSFPSAFDRIELTTDAVVKTKPLTDRVLSLYGHAAGEAMMTVFLEDQELYSAVIIVNPEPGHLVKIYGTGKNDDANAGHIAVMCNQFGCGRPDKDLPRPSIEIRRVSIGSKDK